VLIDFRVPYYMTLTLEAEDKTLRPWPECREAEAENEVKIWAGGQWPRGCLAE